MERYCKECGSPYVEGHHVIYRSQAKYMENVPIVIIDLCNEPHKGNKGPHLNKKTDLKYKRELQAKLKIIFTHDYYTLTEIKEILNISKKEVERVVNKCPLSKEGYSKEDLIKRCMGGRLYYD